MMIMVKNSDFHVEDKKSWMLEKELKIGEKSFMINKLTFDLVKKNQVSFYVWSVFGSEFSCSCVSLLFKRKLRRTSFDPVVLQVVRAHSWYPLQILLLLFNVSAKLLPLHSTHIKPLSTALGGGNFYCTIFAVTHSFACICSSPPTVFSLMLFGAVHRRFIHVLGITFL